ncbi:PLP-dependent aminotransferase family protein [Chenggangzhangella methanolivorans]|uniref:PLP-dependent aminotransferase family protein n=1 Tax=Chenggangzhangella methanolivorans TaxID=1437009 RepID=A0A9E6RAZ5_9HYPH|nr:PLP-dependent aminotransferase family protein [Chenggangzhangella methanolivorans]QZO01439.1 PLP-dependent aminotransferase family protein [Chenggangzhangella methanolivorans]
MDQPEPTAPRGTLIDGVIETVRRRIASRSLTPGAKLPSVRAFARSAGVSTSTVVEAYERLAAEGAIRSRPGSGFYVESALAPLSLSDLGPRLDREVDPFWISRQSLEAEPGVLTPGCGWLPPSWMPEAGLRRALRTLARGEAESLTDYGPPLGFAPLRRLLSRRFADHGVEAPPDQIVLAESGTQAIDLLCRFLLEPGDTVLLDDPCYFNFHALLRAHRAKIVGVPYGPNGPDLERFAEACREHRPRLYMTNSAIHNPTGASLSPVVAHRLLKIAEEADLTIVEDDIFADLGDPSAPCLAAFDGLSRVVQVGSFSKTLSASVRCGYIAAPADWIEDLVDLRIATSFGGGRLSAELLHALLKDGGYRRHVEALRVRLAEATGETARRLKAVGVVPWIEPRAGMFLWCRLPEGVDASETARRALTEDVVLAPGDAFSLSRTAGGFMRFNVAQSGDPRLYDVLGRAMQAA